MSPVATAGYPSVRRRASKERTALTLEKVILASVAAARQGQLHDVEQIQLYLRDLQLGTDSELSTLVFGDADALKDAFKVACVRQSSAHGP